MGQPLITLDVSSADDMAALGRRMAELVNDSRGRGPLTLGVRGELGAGKSTLLRGMLRGLGVDGPVPSPTYTLVEPYESRFGLLLHVDLYRISEADEAEFLGLRDAGSEAALIAVEWPERSPALLAAADVLVDIEYSSPGRRVTLSPATPRGARALARLVPSN